MVDLLASGGRFAAADTSVLPFGTVLSVPGYGRCVVEDRGAAIKGNRLDLFFDGHDKALLWGRRTVLVTVLGKDRP